MRRALVWFRRDLRARDHSALHHAARDAESVVGVWCVSPRTWRSHDDAPIKVDLWLRSARALSAALGDKHIPLKVLTVEDGSMPAALAALAAETGCEGLYFNREYEVDERRRDEAVAKRFVDDGRAVKSFDDRVLMPPGEVLNGSGEPYTVFTPFKRKWGALLAERGFATLSAPRAQSPTGITSDRVPDALDGFRTPPDPSLWPAGEEHALKRLKRFIDEGVGDYARARDIPSEDGTSRLSPYLAAGVLSPRQCVSRAVEANGGRLLAGAKGPSTWVGELAWRDFYTHVLVAHPRVSMNRAYKRETERLAWRDAPGDLARWEEGRTGVPIVDAAMRQLAATGWMHNRLRMVAATFLAKDLLLDWRHGERHFMRRLVDGDLASNNGGWQWCASTGTDAQPYFRVFNPASQAKRYDPDGAFVRHWVPELRDVDAKTLARLYDGGATVEGYPAPMVDHREASARAIAAFRALK